jgi:Flp pilus assembly protein TadD
LDTQGTIFLKIEDAEKAIACLEEATIGGTSDARFYLHLAAAYHRAQRPDDALQMLTEARALALEKFVLTEDDRQILAMLDRDLNPRLQPASAP